MYITLNTTLPPTPEKVPLYRGRYGLAGNISFDSPNVTKEKTSIPDESEVQSLAEKALEPYGGIPPDAVMYWKGQILDVWRNAATNEIIESHLQSTNIIYHRQVNGMPVSGQSIRLAFGENGELLSLNTQWRSLTEIDQVPVISPRKAIEKIQQGEVFNDHYHPGYVRIDKIYLGYYAAYPERQEEILEPVWIFSGKKIPVWTFSGENDYEDYGFSVDARVSGSSLQFANFTASTTSGPVPLTVIFNDTSTGPIDLWAWDFGDGTSTNWTQNPVHTDLKEGKYTVKLLAFDEERDDTLTKADYITVTSPP